MLTLLMVFFGIVDLIVGIMIAIGGDIYLGDIGKFVGYALIAKGIWSMIVGSKP